MHSSKLYVAYFLIALSLLFGLESVYAQSTGDLLKKGNLAFLQEKYDEALEAYEEASVGDPESPFVYFNKGTVQYMKGNYKKAIGLFEQAAIKSKDLTFEARSHYNLGNSAFRESERQRDSDLQKSLRELENAIRYYQKTLKLDPTLQDAAYNIEIARLTMKQLLDEIKKREEQKKKQDAKQQQFADNLKELIRRQEQLAKETESMNDDKTKKIVSNKTRDRIGKIAAKQKDVKTKTGQIADQIEGGNNQLENQAAKAKEHLQKSVSNQSVAEEKLQNSDLKSAWDAQNDSAVEMKKALELMTGKQDTQPQKNKQNPQKKQEEKSQSQSETGEKQPKNETSSQQLAKQKDKNAKDILNEERENRKQRQLSRRDGYRSVDKDW